ncbi:hypothetical protein GCM10010129_49910 [Streptomyces fumigatiscleroticus]|nr:hypothetical protein GCM10010129_49910 [Streptomyces fumigatiscleroticus]
MTWSLRPPFGACTASASVILPPLRVMRTWTGPYWVCATSPVTVRAVRVPPGARDAPEPASALSSADWRDRW